MNKVCQACTVYEATIVLTYKYVTVYLCHTCLGGLRSIAKDQFKLSQSTRRKAHKGKVYESV